nr:MAG TPA: hypothetical protein [Caudoviricetes sp.]
MRCHGTPKDTQFQFFFDFFLKKGLTASAHLCYIRDTKGREPKAKTSGGKKK